MQEFITVHEDCIQGVLHGFDRMIFRGTVRCISYTDGLGKYMNSQGILLKDFDHWAQRCTRRLADHFDALAKAVGRPCVYLASSAVSKEQRALAIARTDRIDRGLVCVLSCVEPCVSASIRRNAQSKHLELEFVPRKCKFYYLYLIHPVFGWMHIRIQSWIPFEVQVYVNGRSFLQRQLDKAGIGYVQQDNCFTRLDNLNKAQRLIDQLGRMDWCKVLRGLVEPFWPACQTGLLPEALASFYWTLRQSEVATDVMFKEAADLAGLYPRLCRHAIEAFSCQDILRFMDKSPSRFRGEVTGSLVKLVQGVRVKHHVASNSIKMYDKGGSVLRIETTINNPKSLRVYRGPLDRPRQEVKWRCMSKSVADLARRETFCRQANQRYLSALAAVGLSLPAAAVLDGVSRPVVQRGQRDRALRPVSPDDAAVFAGVMDGKHLVNGLSNGSVQAVLFTRAARDQKEARRRSNWVGRRLRLLRHHGLIKKLGIRRLYRITDKGTRVMGLALALRASTTLLSTAA